MKCKIEKNLIFLPVICSFLVIMLLWLGVVQYFFPFVFNIITEKKLLFLVIETTNSISLGFLFILGFWWSFRTKYLEDALGIYLDRYTRAYRLTNLAKIFGWINVLPPDMESAWKVLADRIDNKDFGKASGYEQRYDFCDEKAEIGEFKIIFKKLFNIKIVSEEFFLATGSLFFISVFFIPLISSNKQNFYFKFCV